MNRKNLIYGLQFDRHFIFDYEIHPIPTFEVHAFVFDRKAYFGTKAQFAQRQLTTKACQYADSNKPGPSPR